MTEYCYGFKALDPTGCTYYNDEPFVYNLPQRGQKWAVTEHPEPAEPDGKACGPGRLHLMKRLDARYAPLNWWPWYARGVFDEIGNDSEKAAFAGVELRRINRRTFWRCLRPPFNWGQRADLSGADLRGADLHEANLHEANLYEANLYGADLSAAVLSRANLSWANLSWANLRGADLYGANLRGADLRGADLYGANLYGADLRGANLSGANLEGALLSAAVLSRANLSWANLRGADLYGADLRGADLYGANLYGADLRGATWNSFTTWPDGLEPPKEAHND